MNNKIYVESSGISLIDKTWGGFYISGTYFLIGPRGSGKTIIGLQYARECVRRKQICVFFTSMKPRDLLILAATIDFDMEAFINQNMIIVIKIGLPTLSGDFKKHDEELSLHWNEITNVAEYYKADKIIFDDFTSFLEFNRFTTLADVFHNSTEILGQKKITSLFILSDPANKFAESLVNTIIKEGNGLIYINNEGQKKDGVMTIIPILGHPEGQFKSRYTINAYEGISVDYIDSSPVVEMAKGKIKNDDDNERYLSDNGRKNLFNEGFGTDDNLLTFGDDGDDI